MFYPSLRKPAPEALRNWQERRRMTRDLVSELQSVGECYQCADQASGGRVFGSQHIVYSDDRLFAALSNDPRAPGHTVVVWRAHVHDFSKLEIGRASCRDRVEMAGRMGGGERRASQG